MANPKLLLLDEISLGLAPIVVKQIYTVIPTVLNEGTTVVLVEQDIQRASEVSNRLYCLARGRVALEGPARDLDKETLISAYFGVQHR